MVVEYQSMWFNLHLNTIGQMYEGNIPKQHNKIGQILSGDVGWNLMQQSTGVCSGGYNRLGGNWNRFQSIIHNITLGYISLRMLLRGWHTVGQLSTLFNVITWERTAINNRGQYTINIQQSTTMCCSQSSKECSHEKRGLLYMICYEKTSNTISA